MDKGMREDKVVFWMVFQPPLSSNMTLQSVEQTDKETRSFLVSLSLGPLVHFPVECFHFR